MNGFPIRTVTMFLAGLAVALPCTFLEASAQRGTVRKGKGGAQKSDQKATPQIGFLMVDTPGIKVPNLAPAIERSQADAHVYTRQQLAEAIAAGKKLIWIENQAVIDLAIADNRTDSPNYVIRIPDGVTLASGRSEFEFGGMLTFSRRIEQQRFMLDMGNRTRITGLRLQGPSGSTERDGIRTTAIKIEGVADVLVDRCEGWNWPGAVVHVNAPLTQKSSAERVRVAYNYMHHNQMCGAGYGVVISGSQGYTMIDRNTFHWNRHHVAATGNPGQGYIAERNFVLSGGSMCDGAVGSFYEQHFDMHGVGDDGRGGTAGTYVDIRQNTIRGAQSYYVTQTRPAFYLRGIPLERAFFRQNVCEHDDEGDAVKRHGTIPNLVIQQNQFKKDSSLDIAVGDFDGDGAADIFEATGGLWAYSSAGQKIWRYLNYAPPYRSSETKIGDFDGNRRADVLVSGGHQLLISKDGIEPLRPVASAPVGGFKNFRIGDFNGDGKKDIFETVGGEWRYWNGAGSTSTALNSSSLTIDELGFGDFDGDQKTDVFSFSGNQWSISKGGAGPWERLNSRISSNMRELVFADFNGDRMCDIARSNGSAWQVSWGGRSAWQTLHANAGRLNNLAGFAIGDFDGDRKADALHYGRVVVGSTVRFDKRFLFSKSGAAALTVRSPSEMR